MELMKKKPLKLHDVLERIRECIEDDNYSLTTHALQRQKKENQASLKLSMFLKQDMKKKRKLALIVKI